MELYKKISIFQCPICKGKLKKSNKGLICNSGHSFIMNNYFLDFRTKKDTHTGYDYSRMNKKELRKVREWESDPGIKMLIDRVCELKPKIILDICTGRGVLIKKLIEKIEHECLIFCTDINKEILEFVQQEYNEKNNIVIITTNIARLPFQDNSIDCVISASGFEYLSYSERIDGVKETYRVLKEKNGVLLDFDSFFKENSPSHILRKEYYENEIKYKPSNVYCTIKEKIDLHSNEGYRKIFNQVTNESIMTNKQDDDQIPVIGDFYGSLLIEATK